MNSRSGQGWRALLLHPCVERSHVARWVRSYSARKAAHSVGRRPDSPEKAGGTSAPFTSSGLQDTIRTNGSPDGEERREGHDVVLDDDIGRSRSMISRSCGSQYTAPSMSACQVGCMKVDSCSMVGLRNSGAVSRMKSIQNCPASCSSASSAGGGEVDEILHEAERRELALPRGLGGEHDPMSALAQDRCRCPMHWLVGP